LLHLKRIFQGPSLLKKSGNAFLGVTKREISPIWSYPYPPLAAAVKPHESLRYHEKKCCAIDMNVCLNKKMYDKDKLLKK
jgi:hypothetical protein